MTHNVCPMCDEIALTDTRPLWTQEGQRQAHRECMLREVIGGIGHLIAHEYWCTQKGDPDAGLPRRQSALLVDAYCHIVGIDNHPRHEEPHAEAVPSGQ